MADPATRIIDVHSHSFLPLWHEQLRACGLSGNRLAGSAHTMLPPWSKDETHQDAWWRHDLERLIAPALKCFDAHGGFDAGSRHAIVRGNAQRLLPWLSRAAH